MTRLWFARRKRPPSARSRRPWLTPLIALIVVVNATALGTNGAVQLGGSGAPGQAYVLQTATNLAQPVVWSPLATNIADTNGAFSFADSHATNFPRRFYRTTTP
jgi:hypothetical protein